MTPRSIRRAAERKANKLARKHAAAAQSALPSAPSPESKAAPIPSEARLAANRLNAQLSTGPTSNLGKTISSRNNLRHGLAGAFMVLDWEDPQDFDELLENLRAEHQPATLTETLLVQSMAQHYWLSQRAMKLQHLCFKPDLPTCDQPADLALYLRYQTTHERAFHKALNDLLKLRAEKRKTNIGFESQQRKQAQETRRDAAENRKQELHHWAVLLSEAKLDHQKVLNVAPQPPKNMAALAESAA